MPSKTSTQVPSKRELIAALQKLITKHGESKITRNFYRANGNYKEAVWEGHFTNFTKFLEAAGYAEKTSAETVEVNGDKMSLSVVERIHTLEQLVEYFQVDTLIWECTGFRANKWEMGFTTGTGDSKTADQIPLYQVKANFTKRKNVGDALSEIDSLKAEAKKHAPVPKAIAYPFSKTGNMLEINIPDAHFGKLAWGRETGDRSYDTAIAEQTFLRAVETLVDRSKHIRFDSVLFVVGNDLLNADNLEGTTTKGTYVNTDGRYQKTFAVVRRTITNTIERLRKVAPVNVVMVSGNHDDLSVWHLGDSLECYFDKYEDVTINNEPTARKYVQHGSVMLMFTHGDKGKRVEYPQVMAREQPTMWGATRFRECHTGHTHMTKLDEKYGVRVRVLPALCPPDAWHSENGFIGNQRNAEGFIWNEHEGLIGQVFHNDDAFSELKTKRDLVAA